jgi:hypothetical protein
MENAPAPLISTTMASAIASRWNSKPSPFCVPATQQKIPVPVQSGQKEKGMKVAS